MKDKIKKSYTKIDSLWNEFINLKYNKIIFKVLPHNLLLFILFVISIFTIVKFYSANKYLYYYQQTSSSDVTENIYDSEYDISFDDVELVGNPEQFCLKFVNPDNKITSDYRYLLYHNDEVVTDVFFNASNIVDGVNYCFDTPTLNKDNYKEYKVVIKPVNATEENSLKVYTSSKNVPAMCFIGTEKILSVRNLIALIFIIIFFVINYFINKKDIKEEKFWLLVSFVYIIASMFLIPPYQVPDELIHYVNTVNLSQIDYSKNLYNQFKEKEIIVPEGNSCIAYTSPQKVDKLVDADEFKGCFNNRSNNVLKTDWHINTKSKTGYILAAIAFKIADFFSNSPMILFYSGRIINTLLSIGIIYLAIKKGYHYRLLLLSIATIPMFLQMMVSYSYDSILNMISVLIVFGVISLKYNVRSSLFKWSIVFTICGILISDIKLIYLPIFLLLLCVPDEKFKNKYLKILYVVLLMVITYYIGQFIRWYVEYDPNDVQGLSTALFNDQKFNYLNLKEHPLMIFSLAFYTLKYQAVFYIRGLFGYFGWFRYKFSDILIFAYCLYMIYLLLTNKGIDKSKWKKIIICIGLLVTTAGIFASMYFGWTRPGVGFVEGVQGRYFIPLVLPFMLILFPKQRKLEQNNSINYSFINIMLIQYILILLFGYY